MSRITSRVGSRVAALVASSATLAVAPSVRSAPAPNAADVQVVSLGASHTELAPRTQLVLTVVVRSREAASGPFTVRAYYDRGVAAATRPPKTAGLLATYPVTRGISKDQEATFSFPVRIPYCDECGPRTIYVTTDAGAADKNPRNDVKAVTLDVARDHLPDLRVSDISIDHDRGSTSDEVRVRGTVRNASQFYAEGPFRVSVYCSVDPTLTPRDRRLFSFMVPSLGGGQSVGVDRAVRLVPECGVHAVTTWLGVLADDQDDVEDANDDNDGRATPFWVFRTPDLTSRAVTLSATAGPIGSRVLVSYRVGNQGGSAAGAFRTGVYLARPGEALTQGTLLDAVDVPSLAANTDSGLMQHLVTVPNVPRGAYTLGVWVDLDGRNGELHRRNNFRAERFDVTEVNLTDVHFTAQRKEVTAGGTLELRLAVRNTGRDPAGATTVGLYYSDDPRFDRGQDVRIGELKLGPRPAGSAGRDETTTVTLPASAREGYRFVLAVIDDADAIVETDERDNVALEPILVVPEHAGS